LYSLSFSIDFEFAKCYDQFMANMFDRRQGPQRVRGAQRQSRGGRGKLSMMKGRGVAEAAQRLKPDPKKPETCKLPVRVTGHERFKGLPSAQYEQLLTLVFIRTMDLFRAFGVDFQLILGGSLKDGDVAIDASRAGGSLGGSEARPLTADAIGADWNPFRGFMDRAANGAGGDGLPPTENLPPEPEREPPTGVKPTDPTREPPGPGLPPRNPQGPTRPPGTGNPGGPTREPPTPGGRDPEGPTRPPKEDNPTREPPDIDRPGDIDDDVDRNWPTIAEREEARVWGDPHFVGGDGGKYDVQGQAGKTYNLLSDTGVSFYGTFDGWGDGITVVGSTGLTVTGRGGTSKVHHNAKNDTMTVDGQQLQDGQSVVMADGGTTTKKGRDLITKTAEGYRIVQHDKGKHIDAEVKTGDRGVYNGTMPTGLMGCTFDADSKARNGKKGKGAQGEGAIDGVVTDYEVDGGVFGTLKSAAVKGDVDGDGLVTLEDAKKVLYAAMGQGSLTPAQKARADVDGDGQVTMADGMFVMRMAQQAGNMGRRSRSGNGAPIAIPSNGTLQLSLVNYDASFVSRAQALDPYFKRLFSDADLSSVVGKTDTMQQVRQGDRFNLGVVSQAMGTYATNDLRSRGENFMVEQTGDSRWQVRWAGPNGLAKDDFSTMVMDVTLAKDEPAPR